MPASVLKLSMISGSFEYDSETSLTAFAEILERSHPVQVTLNTYQSEHDKISLKSIETTDVLLIFTRRIETVGEELDRIRDYCAQGRPVLAIRTASHGFQNWLNFDQEVLGGNYNMHWDHGPKAHVKFETDALDHPLLQGITEFSSSGSLYRNDPIGADTNLLMKAITPQHVEPVTWIRFHNGGRIFYTSMGHQEDFEDANFVRLLSNAVLWCGGKL